jgi:hypothetical protein
MRRGGTPALLLTGKGARTQTKSTPSFCTGALLARPALAEARRAGSPRPPGLPPPACARAPTRRSPFIHVLPTIDLVAAAAAASGAAGPSEDASPDGEPPACNGKVTDGCCNCASLAATPSLPATAAELRRRNKTASRRPHWKKGSTTLSPDLTATGGRPPSALAPPVSVGSSKSGITYHGGPIMGGSVRAHLVW